jgi:hypothetical protein
MVLRKLLNSCGKSVVSAAELSGEWCAYGGNGGQDGILVYKWLALANLKTCNII